MNWRGMERQVYPPQFSFFFSRREICPGCDGKGEVEITVQAGRHPMTIRRETLSCVRCHGRGSVLVHQANF
jgi:DnaJ-class molecular chaperone